MQVLNWIVFSILYLLIYLWEWLRDEPHLFIFALILRNLLAFFLIDSLTVFLGSLSTLLAVGRLTTFFRNFFTMLIVNRLAAFLRNLKQALKISVSRIEMIVLQSRFDGKISQPGITLILHQLFEAYEAISWIFSVFRLLTRRYIQPKKMFFNIHQNIDSRDT